MIDANVTDEVRSAARQCTQFKIVDGFAPEGIFRTQLPSGGEFYTLRMKHRETGKKYCPDLCKDGDRYRLGSPEFPNGRPLYGWEKLELTPLDPVFVVEGHAKAYVLQSIGVLGVTSGGASSVQTADISPLEDRMVIIWRDNDDAGRIWQAQWQDRLANVAASVRIIDVERLGLPDKGDVVDWMQLHPDTTKEAIIDLPHEPLKSPSFVVSGPEILPILPVVPLPNRFPVESTGDVMAAAIERTQEVIQAPTSLVAQCYLAAAVQAAQAYVDIEMDGRRHPCSEFFITIGESGERKSAVDSLVLTAHRDYETSLWSQYANEQAAYEQEMELFRAGRKRAAEIGKKEGPDGARKAMEEVGSAPQPPLSPVTTTQDPTVEGIHKLLERNRPTLAISSDEGARVLSGHSFSPEGRAAAIAAYNSLWSGQPFVRLRAGDQPIRVPECRVSMHVLVQPVVAEKVLTLADMTGQGLVARFLVVHPETTAGARFYRAVDLNSQPEVQRFHATIRNILSLPLPLSNARFLTPRVMTLSVEAKEMLIEFHDYTEKQLGKDGALAPIRPFGSKALEHTLRLGAVLAFFHDPTCQVLELEVATRAIDLMSFYLHEHLRLHIEYSPPQHLRDAQAVLEWLSSRKKQVIGLAELLQFGPHRLRSKEVMMTTMRVLEDCGRATRLEDGTSINGRCHRTAWTIQYLPEEL